MDDIIPSDESSDDSDFTEAMRRLQDVMTTLMELESPTDPIRPLHRVGGMNEELTHFNPRNGETNDSTSEINGEETLDTHTVYHNIQWVESDSYGENDDGTMTDMQSAQCNNTVQHNTEVQCKIEEPK